MKGLRKKEYDNGSYTGQLKDDYRHGFGVYTFDSGDKYDGQWKKGEKHGYGVYTWENDGKYDGQWKDGKKHGHGIRYYKDGSVWDGQWMNGKRNGFGTLTLKGGDDDGNVYKGTLKDDCYHGYGVMKYKDGTIYDGFWKKGSKDELNEQRIGNDDDSKEGEVENEIDDALSYKNDTRQSIFKRQQGAQVVQASQRDHGRNYMYLIMGVSCGISLFAVLELFYFRRRMENMIRAKA